MKKLLLVVFVFVTVSTQAQEFKPFKVNLSVGYAQATGKGISGGALFSIEPKTSLSPQVDVGKLPTAATDFTTKSSYFGFKVGFDLVGGRRTDQNVKSRY